MKNQVQSLTAVYIISKFSNSKNKFVLRSVNHGIDKEVMNNISYNICKDSILMPLINVRNYLHFVLKQDTLSSTNLTFVKIVLQLGII